MKQVIANLSNIPPVFTTGPAPCPPTFVKGVASPTIIHAPPLTHYLFDVLFADEDTVLLRNVVSGCLHLGDPDEFGFDEATDEDVAIFKILTGTNLTEINQCHFDIVVALRRNGTIRPF